MNGAKLRNFPKYSRMDWKTDRPTKVITMDRLAINTGSKIGLILDVAFFNVQFMWCASLWHLFETVKHFYRKGRNFSERILAKFAKINSFFDPRKCRFAKINFREICQNWWFSIIHNQHLLLQSKNRTSNTSFSWGIKYLLTSLN